MSPFALACDLRYTLEKQGYSAKSCQADRGTQWVRPKRDDLRVGFDSRLKLKFLGFQLTTDTGLLAYRELDEAIGLTERGAEVLTDSRLGSTQAAWFVAAIASVDLQPTRPRMKMSTMPSGIKVGNRQ